MNLIVCLDENQLIGADGKMPWHLPNDLKYFKERTLDKTVVMGRKTWESLDRPLPNRTNVVLTTRKDWTAPGCIVVHSKEEVLDRFNDSDTFIIGGATVYEMFLPHVKAMYVTRIYDRFAGDTYFPKINWDEWELTIFRKGESAPYPHDFFVYRRR